MDRIIRILHDSSILDGEISKDEKGGEINMDDDFLEKVSDAFIKALPSIFRISAQLLADITRKLIR